MGVFITQGANVAYVSRVLGHSSLAVTLTVYSHLIDRAEHAARMRDGLETAFADALAGDAIPSGNLAALAAGTETR